MKVLILGDRGSVDAMGVDLRAGAGRAAREAGCDVRTVILNGEEIEPCRGCFGCWVKTPGLCVITGDAVNELSRNLVRSDAVVVVSELTYGGFSFDTKAFLDRIIPIISPFFEIYRGQMHHKKRYAAFPCWVTVGYGESTEKERALFCELAERNALNMRPPKHFCLTAPSAGECPDALQELRRILTEEVRA